MIDEAVLSTQAGLKGLWKRVTGPDDDAIVAALRARMGPAPA
jgi:hypothetical protein